MNTGVSQLLLALVLTFTAVGGEPDSADRPSTSADRRPVPQNSVVPEFRLDTGSTRFGQLYSQWKIECEQVKISSRPDEYIALPAFRAIVALGWSALPELRRKIEEGSGLDWMLGYAADEISGFGPGGIQKRKPPRFGIYMPKHDVYTATEDVVRRVGEYIRTERASEIPLAEHPIISEDDLIAYDWTTHTLHLRQSIWAMVREPGGYGAPFVVVVDAVPIYIGAFWSEDSSVPAHVPVILWDYTRKAKNVTIHRAYPTSGFGSAEDPRMDPRLKEVLRELGKLETTSSKDQR